MAQFLYDLVSVLQLSGTKYQCFYLTLTVVTIKNFTILMGKQHFWNLDQWYLLITFWKHFVIKNFGVSVEKQYDLRYIAINVSEENKYEILDSFGRKESHFILKNIQNLMLLIRKRKGNIIQKIFLGKSLSPITMKMLDSSEKSNVHIMQKIVFL